MRKYLNANTIANEVLLRKNFRKEPFIIYKNVECKRRIDRFDFKIAHQYVIAHTDVNAVLSLRVLTENKFLAAVAVVSQDDDFDVDEDIRRRVLNCASDEIDDNELQAKIESLLQRIKINLINVSAFSTMIASEKALGRDWNTPEEDVAWSDL